MTESPASRSIWFQERAIEAAKEWDGRCNSDLFEILMRKFIQRTDQFFSGSVIREDIESRDRIIANLNSEVSDLVCEIEGKDSVISELENKLSKAEDKIDNLKENRDALQRRIY